MTSKSEQTIEHILQTTAPLFIKKGYEGTSLSDITIATGLTKGAIYCHFENKEDLAIKAFKYSVKQLLAPLTAEFSLLNTSIEKLEAMHQFYSNYFDNMSKMGGCPVINYTIDCQHNNLKIFEAVKSVSSKLILSIKTTLEDGINNKELKQDININQTSETIYCMIQGAIFMSYTHHSDSYLKSVMTELRRMINQMKA